MDEPCAGHPTADQLRSVHARGGRSGRTGIDRLARRRLRRVLGRARGPGGERRDGGPPAPGSVRRGRRRGSEHRPRVGGVGAAARPLRAALALARPAHLQAAPGAAPAHQAEELPTAWRVGDHEILGEVGRGGMGVVYKARHCRLNRLVALKMVLAGEFASVSERLRFLREAELAARVKHVNIVQVHEIGHVGDRPYLSMEWIEGGTLADRLDGTPWPPDEAAELIGTLARAIDAAHRQGVIHRDLKPANILMARREEGGAENEPAASESGHSPGRFVPKITDFGLAQRARPVRADQDRACRGHA